jgi:hypothetical protein
MVRKLRPNMDNDEKIYADYLTELYGVVNICGIDYDAGYALYDVDPTAFRVGMADWDDANEEDEE